ncbi:MAG: HD domain-containing protein [Eubacterium sp.]|nr:HD domain-containing protein [Eubacterium sp.]
MKKFGKRIDRQSLDRALFTIIGVLVNVVLAYIVRKFELPLYLDTIGSVFVAIVCGPLSGILVGVTTNVVCGFFDDYAIYYTIVSVLTVLCVSVFSRDDRLKKKKNILFMILSMALISGVTGTLIQWFLPGESDFKEVSDLAKFLAGGRQNSTMFYSFVLNIAVNVVDKTIAVFAGIGITLLIPKVRRRAIRNSGWHQKPLNSEEIRYINSGKSRGIRTTRSRIAILLTAATLALAAVLSFINISTYINDLKIQYTNNAIKAAEFTAIIVDADKRDVYLQEGKNAKGYSETEELMYQIRDSIPGIKYLYVVKTEQTGCRFIFDLKGESENTADPYYPGDFVGYEQGFEQDIPALMAGEEIEPVESEDTFGWLLTAYCPIRNNRGETTCYAGADVSMEDVSEYIKGYLLKTALVFSGFFILILGFGLWVSGHYLVYPIGSMAKLLDGFMKDSEDQEALDENVRRLRALDIRTDDEVEVLYRSICEMAAGTTEQMRSIRYFANSTVQMQNGLIFTMADLVENRDSDTGAHIQKTAEYVKIIAKGLKKKGYYAEKLTPKFMSDVVMSAPLHDVGKINISDTILNKPGKLTDDEYEIMKTHTTAGKEIIEKAISTMHGENYLKEARNMAAYHHERWDGKGYPDGLHGQVIPLSARIMAVADVFDALVSPRVYKPAFPMEKALAILEEGAGTQFDPKCVEVFMDSITEVRLVMEKYQGI